MNAFTKDDLKSFQAESLPIKKQHSLAKIAEWFSYWKNAVYVAFSGGKDSSVLADLCAFWCSCIGATLYLLFVNTGLEYPEIQKHVKDFAEYLRRKYNIEVVLDILRPQMRFDEVIKTYGYPMISKEVSKCVSSAKRLDSKYGQVCRERLEGTHKQKSGEISLFNCAKYKPLLDVDFNISHRCCDVMKKAPSHDYAKRTGRKPITAQMADESRLREQQWIKYGCNGFNMSSPVSNPMSFWTEQDVLQYIKMEQDRYDKEYKFKINSTKDPTLRGHARRKIKKWLLREYEFSTRLPIASVYGEVEYINDPKQIRFEDLGVECEGYEELHMTGCQRTGCIFCGFGCHLEKSPNRFERLKITHPRQYEYCIGGGEYAWIGRVKTSNDEWRDIPWLYDDGTPMTAEDIERFVEECKSNENYDFRKVWQPNKQGLGMGHVFEELNKIYGKEFIKYE